MSNKKFNKLAKKAASVFGVAIAALTSTNATAQESQNDLDFLNNTENSISVKKNKPMPILKLNPFSPEDSQFVNSHRSHSSHSSHSSHRSHYSSYR